MTDLPDIIARLEKTDGPLGDADVAELLAIRDGKKVKNWAIATGDAGEDEMQVYCTDGTTIRASEIHEYPDRSVDAALMLVPPEWTVEGLFWSWPNGDRSASACLTRDKVASRVHGDSLCSLAIALCIAALKARSPA